MRKVEFDNLIDLELAHIFECGQCFRWKKEDDGSYTGVTRYGVINIKKRRKKDNNRWKLSFGRYNKI